MSRMPHEIPFHREKTSGLIPWVMGIMIYLLLLLLMGFYVLTYTESGFLASSPSLNIKIGAFLLLMMGLMTFSSLAMILLVFHTSVMVHAHIIDVLLWMGACEKFINSLFQKQARILIIKGTFLAMVLMVLTLISCHYGGILPSFPLATQINMVLAIMVLVPLGLSFLTLVCGRALIASTITQRLIC